MNNRLKTYFRFFLDKILMWKLHVKFTENHLKCSDLTRFERQFENESIFSPAYHRTLETEVSVNDDDDDVTLLIQLS